MPLGIVVRYLSLAYLLLVWVIARLIVPHLGFSKMAIREHISKALEQEIAEMNKSAKDNKDFLKLAYEHVTDRYSGGRLKTLTQFHRAFGDLLEKSPGFLPCTAQNYLLRTMLVRSGRFTDADIELKTVPLNLSIHQYIRVWVGAEYIDVDPWSHFLGVPLGQKSWLIG